MKKLTFILLFTIPFIGFGQDLGGTGWTLYHDNGDKVIVLLEKDNTFTWLNVVHESGNEGEVFGDNDDTWTFNGQKIVILFNDGFQIISGKINQNGDIINGSMMNRQGDSRNVRLELINF